ncbi:hypothetical protein Tco_1270656 [Tanacetum coccineum]
MNELINEVEDGLKDVGSGPLVDHFNEMDNGLKVVINVDSNNEIGLDSMRSELNDGTRLDNLEVRRRKREVSPSNSVRSEGKRLLKKGRTMWSRWSKGTWVRNSRGIMVIWDMRVFDCKEAIGDERFIAVRDRKLSDYCPIVLKDMKKDMKSICPDSIFHDKLKNIKTSLRGWSKDRFGGHTEKIENLKKEAIRFRWDVEGDENLKFFYSFVKRKNNKCNLRGILVNGVWCKEPVVIKTEIARHYKRLFSETRKSRPIVSNLKVGRISFEDAHRLEIAFSKNEVWESIRGCGGDKVPRPDDLNFKFIMKVWNIIKLELLGAITWFWEKIEISRGCNASNAKCCKRKSFTTLLGRVPNRCSVVYARLGGYYRCLGK